MYVSRIVHRYENNSKKVSSARNMYDTRLTACNKTWGVIKDMKS